MKTAIRHRTEYHNPNCIGEFLFLGYEKRCTIERKLLGRKDLFIINILPKPLSNVEKKILSMQSINGHSARN